MSNSFSNEMKNGLCVAAIVLAFGMLSGAMADAKCIKYQNGLTPAVKCKKFDLSLERVIYIDDVGTGPEDPNGAQEIPIILGLDNLYVLVAIGATSGEPHANLVRALVSKAGRTTEVLTNSDLTQRIIDEAYAMACSDRKLVIAVGGPWEYVKLALQSNSAIKDHIKVVGIGDFNIGLENGSPKIDSPSVQKYNDYLYIDDLVSEVTVITESQFESVFEVEPGYSRSTLNSWFDNHIGSTASGDYFGDLIWGFNQITKREHTFLQESRWLNANQQYGGSHLRIADFLTVARVIWSDNIFSKQIIYPRLQIALARIQK